MPYVIAEPCVDTKNAACTEVCPVDCIKSTEEEPQYYIDPEICIECEQCVFVCPVDAIALDKELPEEWRGYIEKNAEFFRKTKEAPAPIPLMTGIEMVQAAHAKAVELGIHVTAAIVDDKAQILALAKMDEAPALSMDLAISKAYTAAAYQLPTHELLGAIRQQRGFFSVVVGSQGRIIALGGGMPILQGVNIVGAVGVSGGTPEQDQQCCRAAATVIW